MSTEDKVRVLTELRDLYMIYEQRWHVLNAIINDYKKIDEKVLTRFAEALKRDE